MLIEPFSVAIAVCEPPVFVLGLLVPHRRSTIYDEELLCQEKNSAPREDLGRHPFYTAVWADKAINWAGRNLQAGERGSSCWTRTDSFPYVRGVEGPRQCSEQSLERFNRFLKLCDHFCVQAVARVQSLNLPLNQACLLEGLQMLAHRGLS